MQNACAQQQEVKPIILI